MPQVPPEVVLRTLFLCFCEQFTEVAGMCLEGFKLNIAPHLIYMNVELWMWNYLDAEGGPCCCGVGLQQMPLGCQPPMMHVTLVHCQVPGYCTAIAGGEILLIFVVVCSMLCAARARRCVDISRVHRLHPSGPCMV